MKRLLCFFNWIYLLSLTLWVGGMFFVGILAEIVVRVKLKDQPITASKVMTGLGTAFNIYMIKYICILIVVIEVVKWVASWSNKTTYIRNRVTKWSYTREVCLAVMIALAFYMGSILRPQMQAIDQAKKAVQLKTVSKVEIDTLIKTTISHLHKAEKPEAGSVVATQLLKIIKNYFCFWDFFYNF